jgi:PPOX class probable FMN-dependent enzyme
MSDEMLVTTDEIRAHYGQPSPVVIAKQLPKLDRHARAFIALSPFIVIASSDAAGRGDATPRGDPPGFVAVLDDRTLLIPDRTGNRRVDTMMNVAENPQIGILFIVPGLTETLRVNGRAGITTDATVLNACSVLGKPPVAGLLVSIEEVYFQCGKAMIRADLWNPDRQIDKTSFPSLARIIADQIDGVDFAKTEQSIAANYDATQTETEAVNARIGLTGRNGRR